MNVGGYWEGFAGDGASEFLGLERTYEADFLVAFYRSCLSVGGNISKFGVDYKVTNISGSSGRQH